jgi:hypothetical protein
MTMANLSTVVVRSVSVAISASTSAVNNEARAHIFLGTHKALSVHYKLLVSSH